jgi:excisionase family DNA binding protein
MTTVPKPQMKPARMNNVTSLARPAVPRPFDLATDSDHYVTVTELARYWNVSVDTVYRDIKKGALRAYRVGSSGKIRVRVEDARQYGRPVD